MSTDDLQQSGNRRVWPVRVVGLMLFVQSAAWLAVAAYLDFPTVVAVPVAALAFLAAVGFAFLNRHAWVVAMLVQAVALAITLTLHLQSGPSVLDLSMGYSVLLVLYINSRAVRAVLHQGAADA